MNIGGNCCCSGKFIAIIPKMVTIMTKNIKIGCIIESNITTILIINMYNICLISSIVNTDTKFSNIYHDSSNKLSKRDRRKEE